MKKTITSLLLLTSFVSMAQITIDSTDIGMIGDQVINLSDVAVSGISVLPASTNAQTFDYSSLGFSGIDTLSFMDPTGMMGASNFPNSNLVLSASGGDLTYLIKTQSSAVVDGVYGDPMDVGVVSAINFNPNVLLSPFPLTLGTNYGSSQIIDTIVADTFTGIFDSLRLKRVTNISSVVDAFGTLNLPNGNYNVLRQHDVEVASDTVWGKLFGSWQEVQAATGSKDYYKFLAKGKSYYVLQVEAAQNGSVIKADFQAGNSLLAGVSAKTNVDCNGGSNGMVAVAVIGGTVPYTYTWSTGASSQMISNLGAGSYSVTVTDAASNTYSLSMFVSQPDTIGIVSTSIGHDDGTDNGFVDIAVSGGTPSFVYSWSNGVTTKNVSNLTSGTYTVTVFDNNGCSNTEEFIVDDLTSVYDLNSNGSVSLYPNPTSGTFTLNTRDSWSIKIFSLDGKLVLEEQGKGTKQIGMPTDKKGLFVVHVNVDGTVFQTKLQVQ